MAALNKEGDMKNRICFIIPWFGALPSSFNAWVSSASYNDDVDFFLFTDNIYQGQCPDNIKWNVISWKQMKERVNKAIGFHAALKDPYKLCDFKPAYGDIFHEYIHEYQFWGFCDIDIVFGKIRDFITDDLLDRYDKIGQLGHCVLIRNTDFMRTLYKKKYGDECWYKTVFSIHSNLSFDEGNGEFGYPAICTDNQVSVYHGKWYCDLLVNSFDFIYRTRGGIDHVKYLHFENGHLMIYDCEENKEIEILYAHFQSRKMRNLLESPIEHEFFIVPNQIGYSTSIDFQLYAEDKKAFTDVHNKKRIQSKEKRILRAAELMLKGKALDARWRKIMFGRSE